MEQNKKSILVVSATGTQGKPLVKLLLEKGFPVRFLVRNPDSAPAQELIKAGAEAYKGDLSDPAALEGALEGINAVYSILPQDRETDLELTSGLALINAAVKAGVQQFIQASVGGAGTHESFPRWGTGYWDERYWLFKWQIEEAVHKAGFPFWTILKPVSFMENLVPPTRDWLHPQFKEGKLITIQRGDKKDNWVAVEDIAKFAYAAFSDPEKFNHQSITIASDRLSNDEVAAIMTKVSGKKFEFVQLSPEKAIESGVSPLIVRVLELWVETDCYQGNIESLKPYNIPLTSFEEWFKSHQDQVIDY